MDKCPIIDAKSFFNFIKVPERCIADKLPMDKIDQGNWNTLTQLTQ